MVESRKRVPVSVVLKVNSLAAPPWMVVRRMRGRGWGWTAWGPARERSRLSCHSEPGIEKRLQAASRHSGSAVRNPSVLLFRVFPRNWAATPMTEPSRIPELANGQPSRHLEIQSAPSETL